MPGNDDSDPRGKLIFDSSKSKRWSMIGDLTVFLYSVCFLTAVLTILPFYLFVYMEASPSGGVLLAFVVLAFIDVYFLIQIFKVITKEHLKVYENGFVLPKTPGRFTPLGGFVAYNDIT